VSEVLTLKLQYAIIHDIGCGRVGFAQVGGRLNTPTVESGKNVPLKICFEHVKNRLGAVKTRPPDVTIPGFWG